MFLLSACPRPESLRSIGFQITLRDGISQLPDLMVNGFIKRWLDCANAKPLNPTRYRCQPLPGGGRRVLLCLSSPVAYSATATARRALWASSLQLWTLQPECVYSSCGASMHILVNTISREIHLEQADPLQVSVGHIHVPGEDNLSSPGTPTPILHHSRAYARSR